MPNKRFVISWIAVFVTLMVSGFIVFAVLLASFLEANSGGMAFRADGEELFQWILAGNALIAYAFVWIYDRGNDGTGVGQGLRYGLAMGVFWGGVEMILYAIQPGTLTGMMGAIAADFAIYILAGVVLAKVYDAVKA